MAALEPIRMDLFRFVTIRTPQLLSQDRKRLGFIFHPDPEHSVFLSAVTSTNLEVARDEVRGPLRSFDPFERYEVVQAVKPDLFDFAVWLARNRHRLDDASALDEWSAVQPLPRPALLTLPSRVDRPALGADHRCRGSSLSSDIRTARLRLLLPRPSASDLQLQGEAQEGPDDHDDSEDTDAGEGWGDRTVRMMSAATRNSRPSRIALPTCCR